MSQIAFGTTAVSADAGREALLLVRSLRAFGGALANEEFFVLTPEPLPAALAAELAASAVHILPLPVNEPLRRFPFAAKTIGAGILETAVSGSVPLVAWMDCDTFFLNEPAPFVLQAGQQVGFRPVDHTLIGSPATAPPDAFWSLIYAHCAVPEYRLTPMRTSVDQNVIRPYFNAGLIVTRPEEGILRAWSERFANLHDEPSYLPFYDRSSLYHLFMHQAVLAAVILATLETAQRHKLPRTVNYPLHMHAEMPEPLRAERLRDLVSVRYDTLKTPQAWAEQIQIDEPLRSWLVEQSNTAVELKVAH